MKKWIAWFDDENSRLVFQYTEQFNPRYDAEFSPRPWFKNEAVTATEQDGRKTLSLGTRDIDYPKAIAAFEEARAMGKS